MPKDEELSPAEQAKLELLANLGAQVGSIIVTMLRNMAPCECLGCQMTVLETAIQWSLQGHDARQCKHQLDMHIRDMLAVRKDIKDLIAYAQACQDAGVPFDTFANHQGNA